MVLSKKALRTTGSSFGHTSPKVETWSVKRPRVKICLDCFSEQFVDKEASAATSILSVSLNTAEGKG